MEIKVQEYKFNNYVSLSQRYQYYLNAMGKHIRHGLFESWHPNGNKENESHWEHGRFHGKLTVWRDDGSLRQIGDFKEGLEEGLWQFWHTNSKLMARVFMERGCPQNGDYYSPGGEHISSVIDGTGRSVLFDDKVRVRTEENWEDGRITTRSRWYSNGQLQKAETFAGNGLLVSGEYFSETGEKLSEVVAGTGTPIVVWEIESSRGRTVEYREDI